MTIFTHGDNAILIPKMGQTDDTDSSPTNMTIVASVEKQMFNDIISAYLDDESVSLLWHTFVRRDSNDNMGDLTIMYEKRPDDPSYALAMENKIDEVFKWLTSIFWNHFFYYTQLQPTSQTLTKIKRGISWRYHHWEYERLEKRIEEVGVSNAARIGVEMAEDTQKDESSIPNPKGVLEGHIERGRGIMGTLTGLTEITRKLQLEINWEEWGAELKQKFDKIEMFPQFNYNSCRIIAILGEITYNKSDLEYICRDLEEMVQQKISQYSLDEVLVSSSRNEVKISSSNQDQMEEAMHIFRKVYDSFINFGGKEAIEAIGPLKADLTTDLGSSRSRMTVKFELDRRSIEVSPESVEELKSELRGKLNECRAVVEENGGVLGREPHNPSAYKGRDGVYRADAYFFFANPFEEGYEEYSIANSPLASTIENMG